MKVGKRQGIPERVSFDMTPMIDCCFQLIIFFMLSLKILAAEGDFNIRMPRAASEGNPSPEQLPPIRIRLQAGPNGELTGIQMGGKSIGGSDPFAALRSEIRLIVDDAVGPDGSGSRPEVVLDFDYNLRYEYVIDAITAVSGYINEQGRIIRIIEKVNFAERRAGP
ncbi:MAG: ExbD/TolR family protein [Planctomycetota bacterium]